MKKSLFCLLLILMPSICSFAQDVQEKRALMAERQSYWDQADTYGAAGDYETAIQYEMKGLEMALTMDGERSYAYVKSLHNLSMFYFNLGNYTEAAQLGKEALRLYDRFDYYFTATLMSDLGMYNQCTGDYVEAIRQYESALDRFNYKYLDGQDKLFIIQTKYRMSITYNSLGNYDKAMSNISEAIETYNNIKVARYGMLKKSTFHAAMLQQQANCLTQLGEYDEAIKTAEKALKILKQCRSVTSSYGALTMNTLAFANYLSGDLKQAIDAETESLEINQKLSGNSAEGEIGSLVNLSVFNYSLENYSEAIRYAETALAICARLQNRESEAATILTNLAVLHYAAGDFDQSAEYAVKATKIHINQICNMFSGLTSGDRNLYWQQKRAWLESALPAYALDMQNDSLTSAAYNGILLSKGLLLNTEIAFSKRIKESGNALLNSLYNELQSNKAQLFRLSEKPAAERLSQTEELQQTIYKQEEELNKLSGPYASHLNITWRQVQAGLGEDDLAVEFVRIYATDDLIIYAAFTLSKKDSVPHITYLCNAKNLGKVAASDIYTTKAITELIWKPLSERMEGKKNVYFAPAGELYNIAIESLPDYEGNGLISDRWNFYRLSSTRSLALDRESVEPVRADIFGGLKYSAGAQTLVNDFVRHGGVRSADFGTVNADSLALRGGVSDLPGTKMEADKISRVIGTTSIEKNIYTDTLGTETSLKFLSGKQPNILHIATHGFYWTESEALEKSNLGFLTSLTDGSQIKETEDLAMTRSGLLFAGANYALSGRSLPDGVDDGVLTAKEISVLDLRGLDLVVLSACQTGLGEVTGDGVFGLQRGFKKAGANSIVMSLWKVDDDATQIFMAHFYYDLLCEKMTKRASFLDAQRYLRTTEDGKYDKPECWAAFILLDALD